MKLNEKKLGILYFICGMSILSFLAIMVKFIMTKYKVDSDQVVFIRTAMILVFSLPMIIKDKPLSCGKNEMKLNVIRNLIFAISTYFWYKGLMSTSVNNGVVISFLIPIFSTIMGIAILKEKVSTKTIITTLILTGTIVWLKGSSKNFSTFGFTMLMITVCLRSVVNILTKKITNKYNPKNIVHFNTFIMLITSVSCIATWKSLPFDAYFYIFITAIAFFAELILITKAYKMCLVSELQPFDFSRIVFSMIISSLILGEKTTPHQAAASIIIISISLYTFYSAKKVKK